MNEGFLPEKFTEINNAFRVISCLSSENTRLNEELEQKQKELEFAQSRVKWFEEQIKLGKQRQFGKKSEANLGIQLNLFDGLETTEEKPNQPKKVITITYTRCYNQGRRIDTSKLPREKMVHDLADAEKVCKCCGKELTKIGEDVSEQLEYIPAKIKVIEHITPKYTCRNCCTIKMAKKEEAPLAKCLAGASLISEVIIKKYEQHLPLYRQSKIFLQEGIDIPANTLGNWIMQAGELLLPLQKALYSELKSTNILQVDETPVTLLSQNKKGYMWAYLSLKKDNRFALFEYNNTRSGEVVNKRLSDYKGFLQNDGYAGYNKVRCQEGVKAVGCWAHCRRHFAEIIKTGVHGKAEEAINYIHNLYEIERLAKGFDYEARKKIRQEKAKPILLVMKRWLEETERIVPPQSAIGKAIDYAKKQWRYLAAYADYGEAEIDNNLVENQIRPFAPEFISC
jgi:transposase